jgi:hypothetical protein
MTAVFRRINLKSLTLGLLISVTLYALPATREPRSMKTLYDVADGFEFQYPATYMNDRTTSGFRIENEDSNRGSFLKIAEELSTSGCQSLGLENTSSCQVAQKRQYKNTQGLQIAEMDMVNTCSGECDDFVPMRFTVYVANISQKGMKQFIVFEDMLEPAARGTLKQMAQTIKLISPKTLAAAPYSNF